MLLFGLFLLISCNKTKVNHAFFPRFPNFFFLSFMLSYKHTEPDTWAFTKFQPGFIYSYCDEKLFDGLLLIKKQKMKKFRLSFFKLCTKWFAV